MDITIAGKKVEVTPLKWGEYKKLTEILGESFLSDVGEIQKASEGGGSAIDIVKRIPETITKALAICLRLDQGQVDNADLSEILDAIPAVIKVNKLEENVAKIKNLMGLLPTPPLSQEAELEVAREQIESHLTSLRPRSFLSSLTAFIGLKKK